MIFWGLQDHMKSQWRMERELPRTFASKGKLLWKRKSCSASEVPEMRQFLFPSLWVRLMWSHRGGKNHHILCFVCSSTEILHFYGFFQAGNRGIKIMTKTWKEKGSSIIACSLLSGSWAQENMPQREFSPLPYMIWEEWCLHGSIILTVIWKQH